MSRFFCDVHDTSSGTRLADSVGLLAMDPHSRLSQFNQRRPSSGPQLQQLKKMETKPQPTANGFEQFKQSSANSSRTNTSSGSKAEFKSLSASTSRPIASNSRLRRDEKYQRGMFLAFIDGALSQKAKVRASAVF